MGLNLKNFKNKRDNLEKFAGKAAVKANEMKGKNISPNRAIVDNRDANRVGSAFDAGDNNRKKKHRKGNDDDLYEDDDFQEDFRGNDDEFPINQSQKPESFFYFLLDNKYRDLEMSIRGVKDVWDKEQNKFVTKRKNSHCFTDEEAEEILRTVQVHLSTDIKLSNIRMDAFPVMIDAIYSQLSLVFYSIADYRYGRYGSKENQYEMKLLNQKIFLEVMTRIQANYSMAVGGKENLSIHGSVKGQESLQSNERDVTGKKWSY